mmetsp:Transcript_51535/g.122568  ORF Transcript_51535/g.122568 Transcript_51535/m.122568 type:complete len:185 (+) Transcript_51535:84-638(+)
MRTQGVQSRSTSSRGLLLAAVLVTLFRNFVPSFVAPLPASRRGAMRMISSSRIARHAVRVQNPPQEGEREVVDGPDGPIIVTKVGGQYYAADATCPHLGLPMKRGKIEDSADGPILTCNFHNSCFKMKTGECTKWVTGAMGFQNEFVAGLMGGVGGDKQDIKAYTVSDPGDGYVWVEVDGEKSE